MAHQTHQDTPLQFFFQRKPNEVFSNIWKGNTSSRITHPPVSTFQRSAAPVQQPPYLPPQLSWVRIPLGLCIFSPLTGIQLQLRPDNKTEHPRTSCRRRLLITFVGDRSVTYIQYVLHIYIVRILHFSGSSVTSCVVPRW